MADARASTGRSDRLTSSAEFRKVYSEGKRVSRGSVTTHVLLTTEDRPARVGVTAARGLGGAIERNRVKRRLRAAVREVRPDIRPGVDIVVMGSRSAGSQRFQDMVDSVRATLGQGGACR